MKKLLLLLVLSIGLLSCENEQDVKTDLDKLKIERTELISQNRSQSTLVRQKVITSEQLTLQIENLRIEKDMVKQGKEPQYILKLKLKQSHFSVNPMKHIKDGMNAIEFELPVSKEFYDNVQVGTNIVDNFRVGSAVFSGSYGSWKMKVIEKRMR